MAYSSKRKVFSTLVHGPHDFVPLNCNLKSISCEKGDPFLYELVFLDSQPIYDWWYPSPTL